MRFFLHLHECGTVTADETDAELADLAAAQVEATRAARDIMAAEVAHGQLCLGCCIVIADESGSELRRAPFRDQLMVIRI
jgi:hypothetical protein